MSRGETRRTVKIAGDLYAHDPDTGERISRISLFKELARDLVLPGDVAPVVEITMRLKEPSSLYRYPQESDQEYQHRVRRLSSAARVMTGGTEGHLMQEGQPIPHSRQDSGPDSFQPAEVPDGTPRRIFVVCAHCREEQFFTGRTDDDALERARLMGWTIRVRGTAKEDLSFVLCPRHTPIPEALAEQQAGIHQADEEIRRGDE